MKPSDEALDLADYITSEILQDPRHEDIINQVATALDDHTAALRAEVEALRARVVKAVEAQSKIQEALLEIKLDGSQHDWHERASALKWCDNLNKALSE